jgi:NAD(P)-dependent dehydrogenase (short-subunit alcohol dehydrogenase family)
MPATSAPTQALQGRVALITGASRGIGAAVAKRFAREGAHVILVARTVGGLEEVDDAIRTEGGSATLVPLDLQQFEKIDSLPQALQQRFGKLDILVGNAAVLGQLSPTGDLPAKLWQQTMDVNVTANWRLIKVLEPLLKASGSGRAMFVTSGITQGIAPYWSAYAASKTALETLVLTWAAEIANTSTVKANLIDPGIVRTRMRQLAFPGEWPESLPAPETITDSFVELAHADCPYHGQRIQARINKRLVA